MLKKSMMSVPVKDQTSGVPTFLGVIDLPRQVLMPFTQAVLRVWEPKQLSVIDTLLRFPEEQRYIVVVHRDLANACHADCGLLVRIQAIRPTEPQGFALEVECLDTVILGSFQEDTKTEYRTVKPRLEHDATSDATELRLDELVQGVLILAQVAKETGVKLGDLLHSVPHRRALLFRVASLLIQDPTERITFLNTQSTSRRVDMVSLFVAQALHVMNRRKERGVPVGT